MNRLIFLILMVLFTSKSFANTTCSNLFQNETPKFSVFLKLLLKKLESNRIREEDIQIEITTNGMPIDIKSPKITELDYVEILIKIRRKAAVSIELDRRFFNGQRQHAFQTHSSLEDPAFENRGLGTLGYVIAARIAHNYFNSQLFSTRKPNPDTALPLWRRLVDFGIAGYATDPFESVLLGAMSSKRFFFIDDIFNSSEFDFIDRIIER